VQVALVALVAFGAIGAADDVIKLRRAHSTGLSARRKYLLQSLAAVSIGVWLYLLRDQAADTTFYLPFIKQVAIPMGGWFLLSVYLVVVGSSNAVNLTDGLDGLAIMPTVLIAGALGVFAYATGNIKIADYLAIPYISGVGELAVFCGALVGAGISFLWFNTYPAQIFMGDIGSLALGAALGIVAIMVRQEVVCFSSWVGCSWRRPSRWCCRLDPTSSPGGVFFAWRRCIIILNSRGGPSPRSSYGSGSSP